MIRYSNEQYNVHATTVSKSVSRNRDCITPIRDHGFDHGLFKEYLYVSEKSACLALLISITRARVRHETARAMPVNWLEGYRQKNGFKCVLLLARARPHR